MVLFRIFNAEIEGLQLICLLSWRTCQEPVDISEKYIRPNDVIVELSTHSHQAIHAAIGMPQGP